jgi:hypothetical protein
MMDSYRESKPEEKMHIKNENRSQMVHWIIKYFEMGTLRAYQNINYVLLLAYHGRALLLILLL